MGERERDGIWPRGRMNSFLFHKLHIQDELTDRVKHKPNITMQITNLFSKSGFCAEKTESFYTKSGTK